jgi:hypothetical protein
VRGSVARLSCVLAAWPAVRSASYFTDGQQSAEAVVLELLSFCVGVYSRLRRNFLIDICSAPQ